MINARDAAISSGVQAQEPGSSAELYAQTLSSEDGQSEELLIELLRPLDVLHLERGLIQLRRRPNKRRRDLAWRSRGQCDRERSGQHLTAGHLACVVPIETRSTLSTCRSVVYGTAIQHIADGISRGYALTRLREA